MENKGISNRMRNLMQKYIGKKYAINYYGSITIISMMGNTGYFITEINDGKSTWTSNASYGEITQGIKKGQYIEQ